jgi:hypothetical protein
MICKRLASCKIPLRLQKVSGRELSRAERATESCRGFTGYEKKLFPGETPEKHPSGAKARIDFQ